MNTWIVPVTGQEPRLVKAKTSHQAWEHIARQLVGEPRKASVDDALELAAKGIVREEKETRD